MLEFKFLTLNWDMFGFYSSPERYAFLNGDKLTLDKTILNFPDNVQDLYWLFVLLRYDTAMDYFQSLESDFAPCIERALRRQNLNNSAEIFQSAMLVFNNRYQAFSASEKSIKKFKIPATKEELDHAFLKQLDVYMGEGDPDGYKQMQLEQRQQQKAMLGGDFNDDTGDYAALYKLHPLVLQAKDRLSNFPERIVIYKSIRDNICQNDELHHWYKSIVQSMTEKDRMNILANNLFLLEKRFGARENWPSVYRDIFAFNLFLAQFSNGGFYQYFDHDINEVPSLLEALQRANLQSLETKVQKAKALFETVNNLASQKLENGNPLSNFEAKMDFEAVLDQVNGAMLKLAKEKNILPH